MTQLREHGLPEHPPIARPDELARVRVIAKLAAGLRAIMACVISRPLARADPPE